MPAGRTSSRCCSAISSEARSPSRRNTPGMATLREEWHGVGDFIAHGLAGAPFWFALAGIGLAWLLYIRRPDLPAKIQARTEALYALLANNYYIDRFNDWFFAGGFRRTGEPVFRDRRPFGDRRLFRQRQRAHDRRRVRCSAADPVGLHVPVRVRDDPGRVHRPVLVGRAEGRLMLPYLSLAIWVPIVAGLLVLVVNRDADAAAARWLRAGRRRRRVRRHDPAVRPFQARHRRDAVRRGGRVDSALQRQLSARHRRHFAAVRPAEQFHHRAGRLGRLGRHREARRPVHGGIPDHVGPDQRRVRLARRRAVLRFLRIDADPDVPDHRHLGRPEPSLRGDQVLPVHAARLVPDAGRVHLSVLGQRRQFLDSRVVSAAAVAEDAAPALRRVLSFVRRQGSDVAGAYLAARCARRGADRRLGGACGADAQGRRVRLRPLRAADTAGCQPLSGRTSSSRCR